MGRSHHLHRTPLKAATQLPGFVPDGTWHILTSESLPATSIMLASNILHGLLTRNDPPTALLVWIAGPGQDMMIHMAQKHYCKVATKTPSQSLAAGPALRSSRCVHYGALGRRRCEETCCKTGSEAPIEITPSTWVYIWSIYTINLGPHRMNDSLTRNDLPTELFA